MSRKSRSTSDLLVIADNKKPLALAGIMGGMDSAVTLDTADILLESAFFDPAVIAGKSRRARHWRRIRRIASSVASISQRPRRRWSARRNLCSKFAAARPGRYAKPSATLPERKPVRLRRDARAAPARHRVQRRGKLTDVLRRLGYAFETHGDEFLVTPPSYRFDLAIEEDLIEEIARIYGYDKIPANPPDAPAAMLPASEIAHQRQHALRSLMVARDYQEIVSYSFVDRQWEIDFCANERSGRAGESDCRAHERDALQPAREPGRLP